MTTPPSSTRSHASSPNPTRVAFFASGRGSNMQVVLDAWRSGRLPIEPVLVVTNNPKAGAVERARQEGIPHVVLNARLLPDASKLDQAVLDSLLAHNVELVVLAGYMKKIGDAVLSQYRDRIINIHPALLPKFGGQGMYGERVHAAVLAAKETVSGATVHLVNEQYDEGRILGQRSVPVEPGDTVQTLAARVLHAEHELLVESLAALVAK